MDESKKITVYTDSIKNAIEQIPDEVIELSDNALEKKVNPSLKLYELKRKFWEEIFEAQKTGRKIRPSHIYEGIMPDSSFYNRVLKNHLQLAWIISPLTTYENRTKAALDKVTARYEELISMDITSKKFKKVGDEVIEWTEVDPRKAGVLLQTIKNLEERIHGTAIQRQVNVHTNKPSDAEGRATLDMNKVDERLKELDGLLHIKQEKLHDGQGENPLPEKDNGHDRCEGEGARDRPIKQKGSDELRRHKEHGETIIVERDNIRQL
jgi:hypothetical protein